MSAESAVDIVGANENIDVGSQSGRGATWVDLTTGNPIQTVSKNGSRQLTINGVEVRVFEFRKVATY